MVIFFFSDSSVEYQVISSVKSLESKITDDVKIVYYTIGFDSNYSCKNLYKIKIPYKNYPSFHYYKAELSLMTLQLFPYDDHFAYSDSDIVFSNRFTFDFLRRDTDVPLAPYGPHEYPFTYEVIDDNYKHYNEVSLMEYLNVPHRSMRYVWSCFYLFNHKCVDFLEEFTSLCKNEYLNSINKKYYPFYDETPFNVCLWKRNATENLGFCFVNTHLLDTIKKCENEYLIEYYGDHIDQDGARWEYVSDVKYIMFYHGIKDKNTLNDVLDFLIK